MAMARLFNLLVYRHEAFLIYHSQLSLSSSFPCIEGRLAEVLRLLRLALIAWVL
jgi:hypothetical protein